MKFPLAIIPAAGKGTRMGDLTADGTPKCLLDVAGKPILWHVCQFWLQHAKRLVVIIPPGEDVRRRAAKAVEPLQCIRDFPYLGVEILPEPEPLGVCGGVVDALRNAGSPSRFIVALGDCLFDGTFDLAALEADPLSHGVGVWGDGTTGDFQRSYAVSGHQIADEHGPLVDSCIEKPFFGLGAYWFTWEAILPLQRAAEFGAGITDVVQMLTRGADLFTGRTTVSCSWRMRPVEFTGRYLNCTYPEDLKRW